MENLYKDDIFLPVFIITITFVVIFFLFVRKSIPLILEKIFYSSKVSPSRIESLKKEIFKLTNILAITISIVLFLNIPVLKPYIKKILDFPVIDTEAVRISIYSIAKGIFVFYVLISIVKVLRKSIEIFLFEKHEEEVISTIDILLYNIALIVISIISLSVMGISWKLLIPIAGALGIGIGFGIQDVVNNFISGFIILLTKTVKIGDWVTVGENFGRIVDIGIRTSTLRTLDNIDIIIPNSHLISNELINWSYSDNIVRIHIPVGVSYSSDVNLVKETLLKVAKDTPFVEESPYPEARFIQFGESSLDFELLVWINVKKIPIPLAKSELNYRIWNAFKENNIQIPFPQRDVWFKNELIIKKEEK